jgi:hypothetical protein
MGFDKKTLEASPIVPSLQYCRIKCLLSFLCKPMGTSNVGHLQCIRSDPDLSIDANPNSWHVKLTLWTLCVKLWTHSCTGMCYILFLLLERSGDIIACATHMLQFSSEMQQTWHTYLNL